MNLHAKLLSMLLFLSYIPNQQAYLYAATSSPSLPSSSIFPEKLQYLTAILRFPTISIAATTQSKKTKLYATLTRALDNGLRLYNGRNERNTSAFAVTWLVADILTTISTLSDIEAKPLSLAFDETHYSKFIRLTKSIVLPALETASSLYLAYENGTNQQALSNRKKAESFLSLCRIADCYLSSKSVTALEKITLIAFLAHALITAYEFVQTNEEGSSSRHR